jgi:hypothetical protein
MREGASVYIHHHLGLGDHIVCNGLVRNLTKGRSEDFILAVKERNVPSVRHLYSNSNITLDPIQNDEEAASHYTDHIIKRIGFENCTQPNWERSFYNQYKIDYKKRFSDFYIPRNKKREFRLKRQLKAPERYVFLNNSSSAGSYNIEVDSELPIINLSPITDSIFDWIPIIESAEEVHTVDSSVFQLIKQLSIKSKKVFYDARNLDNTRTPYSFEGGNWIEKQIEK